MKKIALAAAAAALFAGPLAGAQVAQAASATTPTNISNPPPVQGPKTLMLDCVGTTGAHGCGPGWIWHDGWRGWACYPC